MRFNFLSIGLAVAAFSGLSSVGLFQVQNKVQSFNTGLQNTRMINIGSTESRPVISLENSSNKHTRSTGGLKVHKNQNSKLKGKPLKKLPTKTAKHRGNKLRGNSFRNAKDKHSERKINHKGISLKDKKINDAFKNAAKNVKGVDSNSKGSGTKNAKLFEKLSSQVKKVAKDKLN